MSNTIAIPSYRINRFKRTPSLFATRRRFPFLESVTAPSVAITEENIGSTAWGQEEQPLAYSNAQAIMRSFFVASLSSEAGDLSSEEYSSVSQHAPLKASPELFRRLASIWKADTRYLSNLTQICNHWAYQQIVEMGKPVIPLLLQELRTRPDYWFSALRKITGENPIPPEACGTLKDMASAWLEWGKHNDISW